MDEMDRLLSGYRKFHRKYFVEGDAEYQRLVKEGQSPRIAMIACSDSRVDPSIVTDSKLGELFVIRNVANLVPPYQPDNFTYHGTSAALEFAVNTLGVSHIVVLGHSRCAGIRALVEDQHGSAGEESFIRSWMQIAREVKQELVSHHSHLPVDQQARICECKAVEKSLENLATFPWVKDKLDAGRLQLHGWHFSMEDGTLWEFAAAQSEWRMLV